ncbi:MAG: hypothetical protein M1480_11355 [Bacteroidetes bacterium]|nr:hypothetical protein [Bacteroidota bacterium]
MIENLSIRQATFEDINFIIETIIEADKSSTDKISICNIFSLTKDEYKELLRNILLSGFENNEFSLKGFLIIKNKSNKFGALCSWVEGIDGIANNIISSNLILSFINRERLNNIKENMHLANSLSLDREQNVIQFEYGYVIENQRRKKIFTTLIVESIRKHFNSGHQAKVQTILYRDNYKSFLAFEKLGFKVKAERKNEDSDIYKIFSYNSKVLMELDKEQAKELVKTPLELIINGSYL